MQTGCIMVPCYRGARS